MISKINKTGAAYIKIVDRREAIKYALMNARPKTLLFLQVKDMRII